MDVHAHNQSDKENNAPDTNPPKYPRRPAIFNNESPKTRTLPPSPLRRSITSNTSRRRSKRLSKLTETPPRPSYATQMNRHWTTQTASPQSNQAKPRTPYRPAITASSARPVQQLRRRDSFFSPTSTSISDSPDDDEDPLNELERAVALQFASIDPSREERRKTLFIPSPIVTQHPEQGGVKVPAEKQPSPLSSDSWTGDDIFFPDRRRSGVKLPAEDEEAMKPISCNTSTLSSDTTTIPHLHRRPPTTLTRQSTATSSTTSPLSTSNNNSNKNQTTIWKPASYPHLPSLSPRRHARQPILNVADRWVPKTSRFCVPTTLRMVERRASLIDGELCRHHESSDADDEDDGSTSEEGLGVGL